VPLLKAVHASAAQEGASLLLGLDANVHEVGDVPNCSRSLSWSLFSGRARFRYLRFLCLCMARS
jgi:hypothetical protein